MIFYEVSVMTEHLSNPPDDTLTISFPDLSPAQASVLAKELYNRLKQAGAAEDALQIARAKIERPGHEPVIIGEQHKRAQPQTDAAPFPPQKPCRSSIRSGW